MADKINDEDGDEEDMIRDHDEEHGTHEPNVPHENLEERLPTVAFPMAPKQAPFKIGGE